MRKSRSKCQLSLFYFFVLKSLLFVLVFWRHRTDSRSMRKGGKIRISYFKRSWELRKRQNFLSNHNITKRFRHELTGVFVACQSPIRSPWLKISTYQDLFNFSPIQNEHCHEFSRSWRWTSSKIPTNSDRRNKNLSLQQISHNQGRKMESPLDEMPQKSSRFWDCRMQVCFWPPHSKRKNWGTWKGVL